MHRFAQLHTRGVALEAMLLKPNMILPGSACQTHTSVGEVAAATISCLRRSVPAAVVGVAFLSGGQSGDLACSRLAVLNGPAFRRCPGRLGSPSVARSSNPALSIWGGQQANADRAQQALLRRAAASQDARRGHNMPTRLELIHH